MSCRLLLSILAVSMPAYAGWVEDSVSVDVETEDPKVITTSLTQFQEMLNYLNAENLTSPSRVKVKKFIGRLARYHWENDANCSIKDPSTIMPVDMSSSHADYYYESDSTKMWAIDAVINRGDPCSPQPIAPRLKSYMEGH